MVTHEVKCWPREWRAIHAGEKTGDVRPNDRGYEVGDILIIKEWIPNTGRYTGQECHRRITHILRSGEGGQFGIEPNHVLLSLAPTVVGYIVAGPEGGRMVENWDAEIHPTKKAGLASLAECQAAGHGDWDQSITARTAFYFKQWGQWAPDGDHPDLSINHSMVWCSTKKDAGRTLDGREWDEFPTNETGWPR